MKKITLAIIALISLALISLPLAGCEGVVYITGTGVIVEKEFDYKDFDSIEVSNAFQFEITQSSSYSIVVTTHENIVQHLDIHQSGNTLIIRLKPGSFTHTSPKATITLPELNKLSVSGASRGSAKGFESSHNLKMEVSGASQLEAGMIAGAAEIDISGASKLTGTLKTRDTRITISGASRCEINGSAGTTDIEVSGASQMNSPDFQMQNTDANISGASQATISTSGTLNVEVSGASTLNYSGNPILGKVNVTGASNINRR